MAEAIYVEIIEETFEGEQVFGAALETALETALGIIGHVMNHVTESAIYIRNLTTSRQSILLRSDDERTIPLSNDRNTLTLYKYIIKAF